MFTGIIEEIGTIRSVKWGAQIGRDKDQSEQYSGRHEKG